MKHKIVIIFFIFSLSSCSFDMMFLHPHKLNPDGIHKMVILTPERIELQVTFYGENHTPSFTLNKAPYHLGCHIKSVLFESTSGNNLHGWLIEPENTESPEADILFFHGNAGNLLSHFAIVYPLALKGFRVFLFDYSGFGFSTGKAGRKNVFKDAESALSYFINIENKNDRPLLIYGQSLGGNLAACVAAKNQDKADAVVIEGAFSSHKDVAAHVSGLGFIARMFVKEMYASKKAVKKWTKPVLVIHSTEDAVVPFFMGKKIFDNANEPKEFYKIDKAHILGPVYYTDSIVEKIGLLLKRHHYDK